MGSPWWAWPTLVLYPLFAACLEGRHNNAAALASVHRNDGSRQVAPAEPHNESNADERNVQLGSQEQASFMHETGT
jgi:hypothetical protein